MNTIVNKVQKFFADEQGATAVEYGLLAALIAVAIIVTVGALGTKLDGVFKKISDSLPAAA